MIKYKKSAFTLSEILITLGVIGVVSAMTLPTLVKNYQKKVTVERLKSAYSTLYQAIRRSEVDNGTLDTWEIPGPAYSYLQTKPFGEKYFTPYLKNVKECKYTDCFSNVFYDIDGKKRNSGNRYYSLVLSNGTAIAFYPENSYLSQIIVDINGKKGPNTRGKDIFNLILTNKAIHNAYYGISDKPGLYFYGQGRSNDYIKTQYYACSKNKGLDFRGMSCGAWIMQNGWKIPDEYPW